MVKGLEYQIALIETLQAKAVDANDEAFAKQCADTVRGLYVAWHQHLIRTHQAVHKDAMARAVEAIANIFAKHVAHHVPNWPDVALKIHGDVVELLDSVENSKNQQLTLDCKRER